MGTWGFLLGFGFGLLVMFSIPLIGGVFFAGVEHLVRWVVGNGD